MRSRSHLRPSGAASGAGFDVLPVYRDFGQLQKGKSVLSGRGAMALLHRSDMGASESEVRPGGGGKGGAPYWMWGCMT